MSSPAARMVPSPAYAPPVTPKTGPRESHEDLITQVLTKADAKRALDVLYKRSDVYWACDTETTGLDVKLQGPVGNGNVTCLSIYGGPDIDFGDGPGSALWIENIDSSADLLQEFKQWFEDARYKKVWHNYGFDRHVMFNEGVDCKGFGGEE
jgi:DNA polymerase I